MSCVEELLPPLNRTAGTVNPEGAFNVKFSITVIYPAKFAVPILEGSYVIRGVLVPDPDNVIPCRLYVSFVRPIMDIRGFPI